MIIYVRQFGQLKFRRIVTGLCKSFDIVKERRPRRRRRRAADSSLIRRRRNASKWQIMIARKEWERERKRACEKEREGNKKCLWVKAKVRGERECVDVDNVNEKYVSRKERLSQTQRHKDRVKSHSMVIWLKRGQLLKLKNLHAPVILLFWFTTTIKTMKQHSWWANHLTG